VNTVPRPFLILTNLSHTYQCILGRSHTAVLSVPILLQEKVVFRVIYLCIPEKSHSAVHNVLKPSQEQITFRIIWEHIQELRPFAVRSVLNHTTLLNPCADMRKLTWKKNRTTLVNSVLNLSLRRAIWRLTWELTQERNPFHVISAPSLFCSQLDFHLIWRGIQGLSHTAVHSVKRHLLSHTLCADTCYFTPEKALQLF
jgi:hypothetical protein